MRNVLLVAIGGGVGSALRFWLGGLVAAKAGAPFWGTLFVNVAGSLAIGFLAGLAREDPFVRYLLMAGLLGGFTTFSAFSLQTFELLQRGQTGLALANIAISIILCMLAVWLGFLLGRSIS